MWRFLPDRRGFREGAPVGWLLRHGWTNQFDAAEQSDPDGDGMLTWQEWVAGCNPTNAGSCFRLACHSGPTSLDMVIRWPSFTNRVYHLSRSTLLSEGTNAFVPVPGGDQLIATPPENVYTDTVQGVGPFFHRISVQE